MMTNKPSKLGQTDLVFGSVVGVCVQDYKSVRIAVMIYATLVNTQTYRHRHTARDRLYYYFSQLS